MNVSNLTRLAALLVVVAAIPSAEALSFWPTCQSTGDGRTLRGGSWGFPNSSYFRCVCRAAVGPRDWDGLFGFRFAGQAVLALCTASFAQSGDLDEAKRLEQLRTELPVKRRISPVDRRFLIKSLNSTSLASRHISVVLLGEAVDLHLYDRRDLLKLVEEKADIVNGREAVLYLGEYRNLIPVGATEDEPSFRALELILNKKKSAKSIDNEERLFISKMLAVGNSRNAIEAASIFVTKKQLDARSYRWMSGIVNHQVGITSSNLNSFWRFVRRVIIYRNGPKSHTPAQNAETIGS